MRRTLFHSAGFALALAGSVRCGGRSDAPRPTTTNQQLTSHDIEDLRQELTALRSSLNDSHSATRTGRGGSNEEIVNQLSELDRRLTELETVVGQVSVEFDDLKSRRPTSDAPKVTNRVAVKYAMDQFRSDQGSSLGHHMYWTARDVFECYGPPDDRSPGGLWKYFEVEGERLPNLCFVFSDGVVSSMLVHENN
jgi:hypothetical protein